jgi:hypothetical protein
MISIQTASRAVNEVEDGCGAAFNRQSDFAAEAEGWISPATGNKREYAQTRIGKELTGAEFDLVMTRGPKAMPPDLSRKTVHCPCVPGCQ